jgi:hypothetical protein
MTDELITDETLNRIDKALEPLTQEQLSQGRVVSRFEWGDESISLGSASHIALSPWRSTKDDPPPLDKEVITRFWHYDKWQPINRTGQQVSAMPNIYPSWAPLPDHNDGTTPEDWT